MTAMKHSSTSDSPRLYHAGTLTYTSAGLVVLFVLLLTGDFVWALKDRSVGVITKVMLKQFGASDFLNGLLITSIPAALGLLVSPVVSYRSDRHRGRWGRRIPYLLITTPIAVVGMLGLAASPWLGGQLMNMGIDNRQATLCFIALFWMFFEFAMIVAGSVFNAFVNDVVPREMLGRFYAAFRLISLLDGIIFNFWLLGWADTHHAVLFIGVGTLYGLGMTAMCLRVREGEYPPVPEPAPGEPTGLRAAFQTYFSECFGHRFYWLIYLANMLFALAFMPVNTYCIFYAQSLGVGLDRYGKYMAISFVISFCLTYFVGMLADRFHPLRCCMATVGLYAVVTIGSYFLISGEKTFAAALLLHSVICGAYTTATASLLLKMLPSDRFAQFCSAAGIVSTLTNIVAVPAMGKWLDWSQHDYRLLFAAGGGLSLLALLCGIVLDRTCRKYGGLQSYQAPDVSKNKAEEIS